MKNLIIKLNSIKHTSNSLGRIKYFNKNERGMIDGIPAKRSNEYLSRISDILNLLKDSKDKNLNKLYDPIWETIKSHDKGINDDLTWSKWTYIKDR